MSGDPILTSRMVSMPDYSSHRPDISTSLRRRVRERHIEEIRGSVDRCVNDCLQKWIARHDGDSLSQGRVKIEVTFEPMVQETTGTTATMVIATAVPANTEE